MTITNKMIVDQAWYLFRTWYEDPCSEQTARCQNGLFEYLKESDENWPARLGPSPPPLGISISDEGFTPPSLGVHVSDSVAAKEKLGG
jgi:hypothetical protein